MPFTPFVPTIGGASPPLSPALGGTGQTSLPLTIANGGTGAASASAALNALGGLTLQATTGLAGFALVNATPTFLTWTVPNDGLMHRALIYGTMQVTVAETGGTIQQAYTDPGGTIQQAYTDPGGTAIFSQVIAGGLAAGAAQLTAKLVTVQANTTVSLRQSAALTAGTATLWAEIWGL